MIHSLSTINRWREFLARRRHRLTMRWILMNVRVGIGLSLRECRVAIVDFSVLGERCERLIPPGLRVGGELINIWQPHHRQKSYSRNSMASSFRTGTVLSAYCNFWQISSLLFSTLPSKLPIGTFSLIFWVSSSSS